MRRLLIPQDRGAFLDGGLRPNDHGTGDLNTGQSSAGALLDCRSERSQH
jgi:hypothetical protein